MSNQAKRNGVMHTADQQKKYMWVKIAGAAALLAVGVLLYRKKQTKLGSALMSGSLTVLTSAIPETQG